MEKEPADTQDLRQRAALRRSLADLAAAGVGETVLAGLREQVAAVEQRIRTEGGAAVAGDVTPGRDFVGRDQFVQ